MTDPEVVAAAIARLRSIRKQMMELAAEAQEIATSTIPRPAGAPEKWAPEEVGSIKYESEEMEADIENLIIQLRLL